MKFSTSLLLLLGAVLSAQATRHHGHQENPSAVGTIPSGTDFNGGINDAFNDGIGAGIAFSQTAGNNAFNAGVTDHVAGVHNRAYTIPQTTVDAAAANACAIPTAGTEAYHRGYSHELTECKNNFYNAYVSQLGLPRQSLQNRYEAGWASVLRPSQRARLHRRPKMGDGTQW